MSVRGQVAPAGRIRAPRFVRPHLSAPVIALLLAILLFAIGGMVRTGFASYGQAMNILRLAALLGIIAAGQTLVIIGGGDGIDLSVGAIITLSATLAYRLVNGNDGVVLPVLALCLGVGLLVGAINGLGVTVLRIPPLVMTLGMAGVVQGSVLVVTQGQMQGAVAPSMRAAVVDPLVLGVPGVVFMWLPLGIAVWLLLQRTVFGKHLFAIGANRATATLSGVRVPRVAIATYALSGMLAALGGFILLGYAQVVFLRLGDPYTLPSIAAVVVGGTVLAGGQGGYAGTMAGALVLTLITSLLTTLQMPESTRQMVYGGTLLLLLAAYGRQRGLRQ